MRTRPDLVPRRIRRPGMFAGGDGSTLSLDFTSMSGLDTRFTFSRSSTATVINSSGLVQYADANLILQSESLATSPWIPTNGASVADVSTTNPIGGSTATQLTSGGPSNSVLQGPSLAANVPHTVRFWVRGGTSTQMQFGYFSGSFQTASNITVVGNGSVTGTGLMTITGLSTTTWTQVTFVLASPATAGGSLLLYPDTASPTVGRTNFVWGVQINAGSTASAYNRTTTSAYHAPRFDYDPTTLAPRGLLIEGSATNICTYSGDMTQSGAGHWSVRTALVTTSWTGFTAPDGTASAVKIIPDTTSSRHTLESASTTITSGLVYTASAFVKADGYSVASLVVAGGQTRRNFTLSGNGTPESQFGLSNTATITPVGSSGWYRVTMTWTANITNVAGFWIGVPQNASTDVVTPWSGNGTSGIQAWGAQLEAGSGASSYIPTGSSTVQRAADVCTLSGTNFSSWFNSTQGTFLAHALRSRTSDVGRIASANDNTANESIDIGASTTGQFIVTDGGSALATITPGTVTANTAFKIAGAFALNNVQAALGGTLGTADTSVTLPTVTQLHIGRQGGASPVYLNGTVSLLKFWPTRLPDATLQSLTA